MWEDYHNEILSFSAQQLEDAYSRMDMEKQPWTKYTSHEIDYILLQTGVTPGCSVLDIGCGTGRHTIELARRGYMVTAIEPSSELIGKAIDKSLSQLSTQEIDKITFVNVDARKTRLIHGKYDLAICLYDVIGSYRTAAENEKILNTISRCLNVGGKAVISVMNMDLTQSIATNKCSVRESPVSLLKLKPSNIMQASGDIFNPEYFMLDMDEHLVYRKEQFESDDMLSTEYVIADYRYTKQEICEACDRYGLKVISAHYVSLGHWDVPCTYNDPHAKEILLVLEKR